MWKTAPVEGMEKKEVIMLQSIFENNKLFSGESLAMIEPIHEHCHMSVGRFSLTSVVLSAGLEFLSLFAPLGRILSWFHKLPKKGTWKLALGCVCRVYPELECHCSSSCI